MISFYINTLLHFNYFRYKVYLLEKGINKPTAMKPLKGSGLEPFETNLEFDNYNDNGNNIRVQILILKI